MVEILNQNQFSPLSVAEQVIRILAGSAGLVDDIEVSEVSRFIEEMLAWMKLEADEYIEELNDKGQLSDELEKKLAEAIETFKTIYKFSYGK